MTRLVAFATVALALIADASTPASAVTPAGSWSAERHACAPAHGTTATCFARYRVWTGAAEPAASDDKLITATDIRRAYHLPAAGGGDRTIAIVDAQDEPNAEADLAVYRQRFGLPACTTANGCFRKVNQNGKPHPLPQADSQGWGIEIELDLQAASAACPSCRILLVEAFSPFSDDLGAAVDTAVRLGGTVVSNSYGLQEYRGMAALGRQYYQHPGVPIIASSGDSGFTPASFPAVLPYAVAVGGTTLTRDAAVARGYTEAVWPYAGSACSAYVSKPAWQHDPHCRLRTVADVSAVADNFAVYDSSVASSTGWIEVGGTSLSAPLIAAMIARSSHPELDSAAYLYAHQSAFFDVTTGSNGVCGGDYLCTGKPGYDAPTGVGTPNGLGGL